MSQLSQSLPKPDTSTSAMNAEMRSTVQRFQQYAEDQHTYRRSTLNMVAAESATSPQVERIVGSDFSRRYSSPGVYGGDKHYVPAYQLTLDLVRRLFRADHVNVRPVTGNLAVLAVVTGLTKPGDKIMAVGEDYGGYAFRLAEWAGVEIVDFPFDFDRLNIKADEAIQQIHQVRPSLVIFGASEFLYPHPVTEVAAAAHEVGAVVAYDGSHVMGLIAGGQFQDPLREGADVLFGSTHKTFPGPQRGMVASNDEELMERIGAVLLDPPFLQSCYHLNTVVALGVAAAEMLAFGREFAPQIVRNSQALAQGLMDNEVPVFTADSGCTQTHQVILENGGFISPEGIRIKEGMERCGILADAVVRIGTQEVTRLGMREDEMRTIAGLIADTAHGRRPEDEIRADVASLTADFQRLRFCFEDESAR